MRSIVACLRGCFGVLLLLTAGVAAAQPGPELDRLQQAFEEGKAPAVLEHAADRVEVVLLGNGKLYSRAQARYVMEAFFREYPPTAFTLDHSSSAKGSWFASGSYAVRYGEQPLQVYLRFRQRDARWELREIRVEQRR